MIVSVQFYQAWQYVGYGIQFNDDFKMPSPRDLRCAEKIFVFDHFDPFSFSTTIDNSTQKESQKTTATGTETYRHEK